MYLFKKLDIDWILFLATLPLIGAGLITMYSFTGESSFFGKQIIWAIVAIFLFFTLSCHLERLYVRDLCFNYRVVSFCVFCVFRGLLFDLFISLGKFFHFPSFINEHQLFITIHCYCIRSLSGQCFNNNFTLRT